jgi:hypothetical protein
VSEVDEPESVFVLEVDEPESVFVLEVDEPDDEGLLLLSVLAMSNSFFLSVGGGFK